MQLILPVCAPHTEDTRFNVSLSWKHKALDPILTANVCSSQLETISSTQSGCPDWSSVSTVLLIISLEESS